MKFLKWLGILALLILAIIASVLGAMRFHDGPNAVLSGGPFKTGELTDPPEDWRFLEGRPEIEFQTMSPATSRVVWLGVVDGRLYLVSGYMNTTFGKIWKQWPYYLAQDDNIILRIDGKLYEQRLVRLMTMPKIVELLSIFGEKYGVSLGATNDYETLNAALQRGDFWVFEVVDR